MKLSRKVALQIWEKQFGDAEYATDFHGATMYREAYGDREAYFVEYGERIYCGWDLHHILPKAHGGTNAYHNLICTNIITNDEAEDKITFWIDDCLYQVQRIRGTRKHTIIQLQ